jgi:ABC-type multidrug transport system fused ATPase/permease subunit
MILLDDPFSALDQTTRVSLRNFLVSYICEIEHRCVILSTHTVHLLQSSAVEEILVLKDGEENDRGSYEELLKRSTTFRNLLDLEYQKEEEKRKSSEESETTIVFSNQSQSEEKVYVKGVLEEDDADEGDQRLTLETTQSGILDRKVLSSYFQATGYLLSVITIVSTFCMQSANIGMSFWLAYWSTHQSQYNDHQFIMICCYFVISNFVFAFIRSFSFAYGSLKAAKTFYSNLSVSVLSTDIAFFEKTSIGQLNNRFGKDTNTIDDSLPFIMNILLAMIFLVLGSTFMMVYNDPMILIVLLLVVWIYYRIQRFYRLTSRELRRLDSIYRSPVYTLFTDAMKGISELRSLGSTSLIPYSSRLVTALNDSLRVSFAMNIASQWLNIRMQLLGTFITTMLALSIVLNAYYHVMPMAPGLAGLSLSYSFSIVNFLNGFINAFTETEQEMISVERVLEYSYLKSEFNDDEAEADNESGNEDQKHKKSGSSSFFCGLCSSTKKKKRSKSFTYQQVALTETEEEAIVLNPSLTDSLLDSVESGTLTIQHPSSSASLSSPPAKSQLYYQYIFSILRNHCFFQDDGIRFINVSMRYPSSQEDALTDLSLHIPKGSRIVIVGRTGSGKSSFLRLLLRLNAYSSGSILFNNICELKTISKQLLRKTVTILPQKPLLFTGDLRANVDPLHLYSDEEIMIALYESSFLTTLRSISKEVDVEVPSHYSFSSLETSSATRAPHPFPSFPPSYLLKPSASSPLSIIAELPEEDVDEDDDEDPEEASFFSSTIFASLLPLSPLSRASTSPTPSSPASRQIAKEKVIDWSIKGVDTTINEILSFPIEESGNNLSWGQRQLICLARALLKKSDLILIDEISASLDQETKSLVFNALERHLTRNPSTILLMISHHLEGINQLCDQVSA